MKYLTRLIPALAVVITALSWVPAPAAAVTSTTNPRLSGSFIQPALVDSWTDTQLANEETALKNAGITTQILQWTADTKNKTATYATGLAGYTQSTNTDVPDRLLANAEAVGTSVYVGLQISDDWWSKYASDPIWLNSQAALANSLADELWSNYGPYESFAGWYLSFEVDNLNFPTSTEWSRMASFYSTVIGHLHALSPGKPVVVSPFYNANLSGSLTPSQWTTMWSSILNSAPIDIIALQDGVGAGHATTSQLASWFSATKSAISASRPATRLYDDAETFIFGATGLQPMGIKSVIADLNAVSSYVSAHWSFSYDHYQSPLAPYSTAYDATYRNYLTSGSVDGMAPGTPMGVVATATSSQNVKLTWSAPTDNIGVAGYNIYRNNALVATSNGSTPQFSDTQLDGSTAYTYSVTAFDGAGNLSVSSATASVTTPTAPTYSTDWALGRPYTTTVAANPSYPDTNGTELTDAVHGGALYGAAWQGRNNVGTYSFTIDLGETRTINGFESTWLQVRSDYVFLPNSVSYAVSTDGANYTTAATIPLPATDSSTQVKAYRAISLSASGRYVRVTIDGGTAWSMIDEIMVLAP